LLYNKYQQQRLLKSDLNKGKINHNNALQQYQNALSQLIEDKVYLLFLIGDKNLENTNFMVDTSYVFTKQTQLVFPTEINTSAIPEIQQLELNAELAGQQMKSEKSKYIPTLGLKGYLGANQYANNIDPTAANSWFGLSYIGLDLKYPLLFADDKKRKIQQLQLQNLQNLDRMADKTATYYKDAITAKIKIEQLNADLKKQEENLALSLESITILQNRFTEGQESASNLNLEEANLQKLIADYETNKRQYYLYYLDFLKATGKLEILWK
jgi:outer membrane protein TolC